VKLYKTVKASLTGVVDTCEEFLTGVNDTGKACFPGVIDTGEAPNFSNFCTKIRKNSKLFLSMPIGTRRSSLTKKTGGEKSRGTVPLNAWFVSSSIHYKSYTSQDRSDNILCTKKIPKLSKIPHAGMERYPSHPHTGSVKLPPPPPI
jgi:hypothetical protein